jgi:glycosyltransferase involved in cell wall biosynthesis
MTVVLAHDYLTQRGGAERVALTLLTGMAPDRLITSVYNPHTTFPEFIGSPIATSALQRVPSFRQDPRRALALLPLAWRSFAPVEADTLLCSSSGWSHALRTAPGVRKVVYCHNTPRWLWQTDDYARGIGRSTRAASALLRAPLRRWDRERAATADAYVANSEVVQGRLRAVYGIDAPVVPPPVGLTADGPMSPVPGLAPGFLLTISRPRGYKRADAIIEAVRESADHRLVIVGGKSMEGQYDRSVLDRVTFLDRVSDSELRWLYTAAGALLSASQEDFGLTPIEANQFGTPAVTVRAGGFLETIREGANGVFFDTLSPQDILAAVDRASALHEADIRHAAAKYQPAQFIDTLKRYM